MSAAGDVAATLSRALDGFAPQTAIILGSGLGSLVDAVETPRRIACADIAGLPTSGVSGHAGELVAGWIGRAPVLTLSGRVHAYERGDAAVMRPYLAAFKALGVRNLVLTNAAGGVNPAFEPGDIMLLEDHINLAGLNPLVGERGDERFVDMTNAYDPALAATVTSVADACGVAVHSGVYAWFLGPSFETPAEIRMARRLGADAVGMSTVPETILARYLGLRVVGASIITNLGAGLGAQPLSHAQTQAVASIGGARLATILQRAVAEF